MSNSSNETNGTLNVENSLPKLIVFDLDYTLWPFWCDTHVSPPLRPKVNGDAVLDKHGDEFYFYPDVEKVFLEIKEKGMNVCAASRTHQPRTAQSLLSMLKIGGEPSSTHFAFTAWGTGTKIRHLQELHLHTQISYEDMLFFDDENRNRDVSRQLGVCFVEVTTGLTLDLFYEGIEEWRRQKRLRTKN